MPKSQAEGSERAPSEGSARAVTHSVERTSPMGGPFVGTCRLCGAIGLTPGDALKPCPNPGNLTHDDALLDAIAGPADTAPPTANDQSAPSTLAARSEPRYTRAEAPAERTLAEMYADEFSKALSRLSNALWADEEDDGPGPSADEIVDEAIRRMADRVTRAEALTMAAEMLVEMVQENWPSVPEHCGSYMRASRWLRARAEERSHD